MSRRKFSAPETDEDFDVWLWVGALLRRRYGKIPDLPYAVADRRDALLMNWAQTIRRVRADGCRMLGPLNDRVSIADPNPIDYGGDIARYL